MEITNAADFAILPDLVSVSIKYSTSNTGVCTWRDHSVEDAHIWIDVLPGKYSMQVEDQTCISTAIDVDVAAGEIVTQQVLLVPAYRMNGQVRDSDGDWLFNQGVTATYLGPCEGETLPHVKLIDPTPRSRDEYNNHTADRGRFSIFPLQHGRYKVQVASTKEHSDPIVIDVTSSTNVMLVFDPIFRWISDPESVGDAKIHSTLEDELHAIAKAPAQKSDHKAIVPDVRTKKDNFHVQIMSLKRMSECRVFGGVKFKMKRGYDVVAVFHKANSFLDSIKFLDDEGEECLCGFHDPGIEVKSENFGLSIYAVRKDRQVKELRCVSFPDNQKFTVDVLRLAPEAKISNQ